MAFSVVQNYYVSLEANLNGYVEAHLISDNFGELIKYTLYYSINVCSFCFIVGFDCQDKVVVSTDLTKDSTKDRLLSVSEIFD